MYYLIKVMCELILLFILISGDSKVWANILRKKLDNKDNDVIIITDFKGDSLTGLLNQLKTNSSLRPLSERIEKTIKLSNLKNNPLASSLLTGGNSYNNYRFNNHFNNFMKTNDKSSDNRLNGKFNKFNDKINDYRASTSSPNQNGNFLNAFANKFNNKLDNAAYQQNHNSPLIKNQDYFSSNQHLYSNLHPQFSAQINSQFISQPNSQFKGQKIVYPSTNYPAPNYPLLSDPTKLLFAYPHKTSYRTEQTNFDQNKYLPSNYDQINFANLPNLTSSVQQVSSINQVNSINQQINKQSDSNSEIDLHSTSNNTDELIKRTIFDSPYHHFIRPMRFKNLHHYPPSLPFYFNGNQMIKNRNYLNRLIRENNLNNHLNSQLNSDNQLSHSLSDSINPLEHLDDLNGYETDVENSDSPNQSTNELINSLINKLNEKKLSQSIFNSKDDKASNKKNLPVLSPNQLKNLDQDELVKNSQLLTKFEQINNKILTNLLLSTYLTNLTKNQQTNASINSSLLDSSFEDDSQDRLAESSIIRKKVRRKTTQQPNQIIIKKYIQVPPTRRRVKKIQRKSTVNAKPVLRPLIIKKIETPSIVIETAGNKLKKSLNFKKFNLMDTDDGTIDEEDLLNTYYTNGLNSFALNEENNLRGFDLNAYKLASNNYGLNNYDSTNFKSTNYLNNNYNSISNVPTNYPANYASINYAANRNLYLKNSKIDPTEQPEEDSQFNELKNKKLTYLNSLGSVKEYDSLKSLNNQYSSNDNHLTSKPSTNENSFLTNYKRFLIQNKAFASNTDSDDNLTEKYENKTDKKYDNKYEDKNEQFNSHSYEKNFDLNNNTTNKLVYSFQTDNNGLNNEKTISNKEAKLVIIDETK